MPDRIELKLNPLLAKCSELGFLDASLYRELEEYRKQLSLLEVVQWARKQEELFLRQEAAND